MVVIYLSVASNGGNFVAVTFSHAVFRRKAEIAAVTVTRPPSELCKLSITHALTGNALHFLSVRAPQTTIVHIAKPHTRRFHRVRRRRHRRRTAANLIRLRFAERDNYPPKTPPGQRAATFGIPHTATRMFSLYYANVISIITRIRWVILSWRDVVAVRARQTDARQIPAGRPASPAQPGPGLLGVAGT